LCILEVLQLSHGSGLFDALSGGQPALDKGLEFDVFVEV
jgi:hypothetical protein